ncbi:MAG: hypothetical protein ACP5Q0_04350, partial [Halothiobacillus sp.]
MPRVNNPIFKTTQNTWPIAASASWYPSPHLYPHVPKRNRDGRPSRAERTGLYSQIKEFSNRSLTVNHAEAYAEHLTDLCYAARTTLDGRTVRTLRGGAPNEPPTPEDRAMFFISPQQFADPAFPITHKLRVMRAWADYMAPEPKATRANARAPVTPHGRLKRFLDHGWLTTDYKIAYTGINPTLIEPLLSVLGADEPMPWLTPTEYQRTRALFKLCDAASDDKPEDTPVLRFFQTSSIAINRASPYDRLDQMGMLTSMATDYDTFFARFAITVRKVAPTIGAGPLMSPEMLAAFMGWCIAKAHFHDLYVHNAEAFIWNKEAEAIRKRFANMPVLGMDRARDTFRHFVFDAPRGAAATNPRVLTACLNLATSALA